MGPSLVPVDDDNKGSLEDIHQADCIVMFKVDLDEEIRVAGSLVKRAINQNGAKLILVDNGENSYDKHASLKLDLNRIDDSQIDEAKELFNQSSNPIVIYGTNANTQEVEELKLHCPNAKMLGLLPGANSKGLLNLGIAGNIQDAKAVYILACDDDLVDKSEYDFVLLQTSYLTPKAEKADVLLPSPIWAEKEGTFTNIDGKVQKVAKIIDAPDEVKANELVINSLSEKL